MLMAAACTDLIATSSPTPERSSALAPTPTPPATSGPTVTPASEPTPTAILARAPGATAIPTRTPVPTPTPTPTLRPTPTPTSTPIATATPQPTPTPPLVPCSTPTPIPATTPATSGPLAIVFDRSLPGGPNTGTHVNMILYRFRIIGLNPGDAIQSFSLQLPYPPFSACRPDGSDGVVLSLFPWALESGTHVVSLELADGRRAESTFEHVRTTLDGRPWPPCSPWLPRSVEAFSRLPVPEGFCLIKLDPSEFPDPACAPCPPSWEIWCVEPCISSGDHADADLRGDGHEYCHGHQVWQILNSGLYKPGGDPTRPWLDTLQGKAFLDAIDLVLADHRSMGTPLPWLLGENPVEDFPNICRVWFLPEISDAEWLNNSPPMLQFVTQWLPYRT